jgi:peptidoglycan/LPS O-acetylase OafA/YrhL
MTRSNTGTWAETSISAAKAELRTKGADLPDAVRGLAASLVIGYHYVLPSEHFFTIPTPLARLFTYGWMGVPMFFVLSGYLLGGQLLDHGREPGAIKVFYLRRIARILPLYAILLCILILRQPNTYMPPYLTLTQNFYFAIHGMPKGWGDLTWTLACEEQFYIWLPLFSLIVPKKRVILITTLVIAGVYYFRGPFFHLDEKGMTVGAGLLPIDALLLGVVLAAGQRYLGKKPARLRGTAWLATIGQYSYGAYLFHTPIGDLTSRYIDDGWTGLGASLLVLAVVVWALKKGIEDPIRNFAKKRWSYLTTTNAGSPT